MTLYIHTLKEKRMKLEYSENQGYLVGYIVSHMEVDSEDQEALKDDRIDRPSSFVHSLYHHKESVEPEGVVDLPGDVVVTR
jgi:hypothetical protein